jgi:hypothetical protein
VLETVQDSVVATFCRPALIVTLEDFFGRVQTLSNGLTLAKYCQKEWPSQSTDLAVTDLKDPLIFRAPAQ